MTLILIVLAVFVLLVASEFMWRKRGVPNEISRKFIHITVGSFVASWPFFLEWTEITLLSIAFVLVIAISKYLHVFRAIHSVQRPTWGEIFFALSVGAIALITQNAAVYAVALLHMSLADGFAAVLGQRFGKGNTYKVFGATKSVVGTVTFFAISVALIGLYSYYTGVIVPVPHMLAIAAAASLLENMGVLGLDNLFVPALIALALT
jgi:phytol kinase